MLSFVSIIFAVLIFSLLIFVHELGHFVTAKLSGVQVNEFSMFMGPAIWKKKKGETLYSLRCIPFGGYCAMEGEDVDTENPRSFQKAAWWKRVLILIAGATMNFIAGFLIVCLVNSFLFKAIPQVESFRTGSMMTPEMVGINLRFGRIPDNQGNQPQDQPCVAGGENAYFATLPVRRMADAINAAGVPSQVSYSAGAYVCNDLLYTLLSHYKESDTRVGFLHLPYSTEQNKTPSMELDQMIKGLTAAIEALDGGDA